MAAGAGAGAGLIVIKRHFFSNTCFQAPKSHTHTHRGQRGARIACRPSASAPRPPRRREVHIAQVAFHFASTRGIRGEGFSQPRARNRVPFVMRSQHSRDRKLSRPVCSVCATAAGQRIFPQASVLMQRLPHPTETVS